MKAIALSLVSRPGLSSAQRERKPSPDKHSLELLRVQLLAIGEMFLNFQSTGQEYNSILSGK